MLFRTPTHSNSLFNAQTYIIYLLVISIGGLYALVTPTLSFYLSTQFSMRPLGVGAFFVGLALTNIFYGQAIARRSDAFKQRHGLILAGMVMGGCACIGFAKAPSYAWVCIIGMTLFSMSSAVLPQIFAFSREYADQYLEPQQAPLFNSIVRACIAIAWVAAPPTGFFLQDWIGFEMQYYSVGIGYLMLGVVAFLLLPKISKLPPPKKSTYQVFSDTKILFAMVAFALLFGVNHAYVLGLPMLVTQELGSRPEYAGWLMGTAAALEVPVMLTVGWLATHIRLLTLIRYGCSAAVLLYLGVWLANHIWQLFLLQLLNAIFVGCMGGLGLTLFQNMVPGRAGVGSTLFTNTNQLGNILGSLTIAVCAEILGYRHLYAANFFLACIAIGILIWLDHQERKKIPYDSN